MMSECELETVCVEMPSDSDKEGFQRKRRTGYMAETPIVLPILHAAAELEDAAKDSGLSFSEEYETEDSYISRSSDPALPPDSAYSSAHLSYLPNSCNTQAANSTSSPERALPGRIRHRLSVSFGDVSVCDRLNEEFQESWRHKSMPSLSDTPEYPNIDDIILAAATPALDPDPPKPTRRKSLIQRIGHFPDWLANKPILGSISSLASRSSVQHPEYSPGDYVAPSRGDSEEHRQRLSELLGQVRQGHCRQIRQRVLRPSVSLGGFGDWKDVENGTLTVSTMLFSFQTNCLGRPVFVSRTKKSSVPDR